MHISLYLGCQLMWAALYSLLHGEFPKSWTSRYLYLQLPQCQMTHGNYLITVKSLSSYPSHKKENSLGQKDSSSGEQTPVAITQGQKKIRSRFCSLWSLDLFRHVNTNAISNNGMIHLRARGASASCRVCMFSLIFFFSCMFRARSTTSCQQRPLGHGLQETEIGSYPSCIFFSVPSNSKKIQWKICCLYFRR